MSEFRQDPITRDWIILNPERAHRPGAAGSAAAQCPFCAGNEHLAPPPVDAIDESGHWSVRVVPNKFPALSSSTEALSPDIAPPSVGRRLAGYGRHEVIIETPNHEIQTGVLAETQWHRVLQMYLRRYRALSIVDGIRQVVLFRNHGQRAGTSLMHPHSQIVAVPVVAPETRWRLAEEIEYFDSIGCCGTCYMLAQELAAEARVVRVSQRFVTLAPYAARVPYHVQIIPRRHCAAFNEMQTADLDELAQHLHRLLDSFFRLLNDPDYNLVVVTPPLDQIHRLANHWFIDITPRLTTPAGFELGSRIIINTQPPEIVAARLRAENTLNGVTP
jgi:UDPglucose--hexose-1-phosphate uridylyltransferase